MPPKAEADHGIFQDFEGMAFGNLFSIENSAYVEQLASFLVKNKHLVDFEI